MRLRDVEDQVLKLSKDGIQWGEVPTEVVTSSTDIITVGPSVPVDVDYAVMVFAEAELSVRGAAGPVVLLQDSEDNFQGYPDNGWPFWTPANLPDNQGDPGYFPVTPDLAAIGDGITPIVIRLSRGKHTLSLGFGATEEGEEVAIRNRRLGILPL